MGVLSVSHLEQTGSLQEKWVKLSWNFYSVKHVSSRLLGVLLYTFKIAHH